MKEFKKSCSKKKGVCFFLFLVVLFALSACGSSSSGGSLNTSSNNNSSGNTTYSVGGTVSSLSGTLVLENNGGDDLTVAQNGQFTFATKLANSTDYSVTVKTQPSGQTCTVQNGSGKVNGASVTNVSVSCTEQMGGAIQGNNLALANAVSTIAGQAGVKNHADGTGTNATFDVPRGITTDGTNLYITDYANDTIRKMVISTGAVTTIAGQAGVAGHADGTGTSATFDDPDGITTDGTNLYIVDRMNYTIRKMVISTGAVTTIAGQSGVWGHADGIGTSATFNQPEGITTDGTNLYISDSVNNTIRKMVISTGAVTTIAGQADVPGHTDGTGTNATFSLPTGITTDGTNLYISDSFNETIRKLVISTSAVTTIAGQVGVPGHTDGTGTNATFYYPDGITTDGTNLYITDSFNDTIRKLVISTGAVTTVAGQAGVKGYADGTGTNATFNEPVYITTDGSSLFVTDTGNETIRQIK